MYTALSKALLSIDQVGYESETWIICLTDGESDDSSSIIKSRLRSSSDHLHIILIGVNLRASLHKPMQDLCNKFTSGCNPKTKGFFIPTVAEAGAINEAFHKAANSIPVSQTFEMDGKLTDRECRLLIKKHLPHFVAEDDMLLQSFWIKFLFRRVKVFDENEHFNYNETHDELGSSLMETMLSEVEQFLREDQVQSWSGKNHHQLIYDFTNKTAPEFRLVCTSPEQMDAETRSKYERLDLPGFVIPSSQDLEQRSTLDRFLSQALNVPLSTSSDGQQRLRCIDDNAFVLTLDFTMKLLSIHERMACRIPCIVEGETGVSKTALTKMHSILMNSSLLSDAKASSVNDLEHIETKLKNMGFSFESCDSDACVHDRLQQALVRASENTMKDTTDAAMHLFELIQNACSARSCIFQEPPSKYLAGAGGRNKIVSEFLTWFSSAAVEPTFFEINVHASLTETDVLHYFTEIRATASKLKDSDASVVVFLDGKSIILYVFRAIVWHRIALPTCCLSGQDAVRVLQEMNVLISANSCGVAPRHITHDCVPFISHMQRSIHPLLLGCSKRLLSTTAFVEMHWTTTLLLLQLATPHEKE